MQKGTPPSKSAAESRASDAEAQIQPHEIAEILVGSAEISLGNFLPESPGAANAFVDSKDLPGPRLPFVQMLGKKNQMEQNIEIARKKIEKAHTLKLSVLIMLVMFFSLIAGALVDRRFVKPMQNHAAVKWVATDVVSDGVMIHMDGMPQNITIKVPKAQKCQTVTR